MRKDLFTRKHFIFLMLGFPLWFKLKTKKKLRHLWDDTLPLKRIATSCYFRHVVSKGNPQPFGMSYSEDTPNLSDPKMKISLWGPPNRLTLSINKNDVWDRRMGWKEVITLDKIKNSYFALNNKNNKNPYGLQSAFYMTKEGNWIDPYASWHVYPFPCHKPVGQVIVMCDDFSEIAQPEASTSCSNGITKVHLQNENASLALQYLTVMDENLMVIHGDYKNIKKELKIRFFRHRDTYNPQKLNLPERYDYYNTQEDSAWNQSLDAPGSGTDGRFFWITQKMPPEKTFPDGFEYIMMGFVDQNSYSVDTVENKKDLGTSPLGDQLGYNEIRKAKGVASTVTLKKNSEHYFNCYITVVTSKDAMSIFKEAKKKLIKASNDGWKSLVERNSNWYSDLYDRRERGRIYSRNIDDTRRAIPGIFYSWIYDHMMGRPNPLCYEADAHSYSYMECDAPPWHGLPCYNELYNSNYLGTFNRLDQLEYYVKLVEFWHEAARKNARSMFGLPGLFYTHGYLPPIKADRYPHTNINYEFALGMPVQLLKYIWDKWDYGGDIFFLQNHVYPLIKDLAVFYTKFLHKGKDGLYHICPTIPQERWVLTYQFQYNKDTTPSITMFKWIFRKATEVAKLLNVDKDLRTNWEELSKCLPNFPKKMTEVGSVWRPVAKDPGKKEVELGCTGKHSGVFNPVNLTDEVNLDSGSGMIKEVFRTADYLSNKERTKNSVYHLLGHNKNTFYHYYGLSDRWHFKTMGFKGILKLESYSSKIDACWIEPERLLNSRSGRVHLFPCVPDGIDIAFKRMLAKGGFEVTAELLNEEVTFVQLLAKRDNTCRIVNPWICSQITIERDDSKKIDYEFDKCKKQGIIFEAQKGKMYTLRSVKFDN